jgi:hypothetical protein
MKVKDIKRKQKLCYIGILPCCRIADIVYQVRQVQLSSGRCVLCVWVSRDPDDAVTDGGNCMTLTSSFNSTVDNSLGQVILLISLTSQLSGNNLDLF